MRDDGDYGAVAGVQAARPSRELRRHGFDLRLAFEDDRRNVDMFHERGRPLRLHPLRLLRLSAAPTGRAAATGERSRGRGRYRWTRR